MAVICLAIMLVARPELRELGEVRLFGWLQARLGLAVANDESDKPAMTTLQDLPKQQSLVTTWLSKRYRIAPEPLGLLVATAYEAAPRARMEPTLVLAVMAIESGFNPYAQSPVGARGLMQVMTDLHLDKFAPDTDRLAVLDPQANLRAGVKVLRECMDRAGSLEGGLRAYVGAGNLPDDGGYTDKVLAEQARLQQVAMGRNVPVFTPVATASTPASVPARNTAQSGAGATVLASAS
jgi:soluble lytic murein transglycosylase-like protein